MARKLAPEASAGIKTSYPQKSHKKKEGETPMPGPIERPIIFSGEMVRAILDGRKTMTRRIIKKARDRFTWAGNIHPARVSGWIAWWPSGTAEFTKNAYKDGFLCPYGQIGDRLWVKETHYRYGRWIKNGFSKTGRQKWTFKTIDKDAIDFGTFDIIPRQEIGWHKRPSIFMPHWASRINLEITNIKVERLQEISEEDAKGEGMKIGKIGSGAMWYGTHRGVFSWIWDSLNKKYPWSSNPWVWGISFRRIENA